MGPQEGICRLCLTTCDKFEAIEEDMKDALEILLPKMDFAAVQKPVVCTNCAKMLRKCYNFKLACLCTRDYIISLISNKDAVKLNLKDVYLIKNEKEAGFPKDHDICGFCMNSVKKCSAMSVDIENGDVILKNMIGKCLPELDLCIVEQPVICAPCHGSLENCYHFITNCLIVEEKVKKYRESLDVNSKNLIELPGLLQFTMRGMATGEGEGSLVDAIKAEKPFCEEIENADKREIGKGNDIFKLEQMFCEDDENAKEKVEHKRYIDMDNLIFNNEEQFTSEDVLACKVEHSNFDLIKTEGEKEPKEKNISEMDDQKFLLNEEIEIKTEESDLDRFEDGIVLPQSETTAKLGRKWECLMPNLEGNLLKSCTKPTSTNENATKATVYRCDFCSYQAKTKHYLRRHLRKHKDPSEITVYKCDSCSYQTSCKDYLKRHLLVHEDPSEVTMYQCDSCSFQTKRKGSFKMHLMAHKNPLEVTMYKCDSCSYQTRHKYYLKKHLLVHKDPSEVTMYKCDSCSYQTGRKCDLIKHLLVHRDPSKVTMYQCDSCSFQTKRKDSFEIHQMGHKSPSEITKYKCDSCSYQAVKKSALKIHLLVHKDSSEITMHKCDSCLFQTKYKGSFKQHLLTHKSPSEVTMYSCGFCSFQTKRKDSLNLHLLAHKSPSEITMYKCNSCSYQATRKNSLRSHLQVHNYPSKVTMYKCHYCSYKTKQKNNLKNHLLLHKSPSEVTM